jgi:hypothetical protein
MATLDAAAPWSLHDLLLRDVSTLGAAAARTTPTSLAPAHAPQAPPPAPRPLRAGRCQVPDCTTPDEASRAYNQRCRCVCAAAACSARLFALHARRCAPLLRAACGVLCPRRRRDACGVRGASAGS